MIQILEASSRSLKNGGAKVEIDQNLLLGIEALDADMVFDVRCLPNPHYEAQLRPLTGKDEAVTKFLAADGNVNRMFDDIQRFVCDWLPCFIADNRNYLTVAIGCTGGRHRSVYFVDRLVQHFTAHNQVLVRHRDLGA